MSNSTWLNNSKVTFSIVNVQDKDILVCIKTTGIGEIKFIEDLKTGKRIFPEIGQQNLTTQYETDNFVRLLAEQL